jgi:hypothetical protein
VAVSLAIGVPASAAPAEHPSFAKDVAPILYEKCVACHRAGEVGPMPLTTYAEARPWARAIKTAVTTRVMPPWLADGEHGAFANDPRLTDDQITTIARWADQGAPEGNPADMPKLPALADGWRMGTPDVVYDGGKYDVAAQPRSVYGDIMIPTTFAEDRYIASAEVRPGNRAYTHHANVLIKDDTAGQARIASYSPGAGAKSYPAGVAKLIPKGATLNLDMHYNPKGEPRVDPGTKIAIQFAKGPIRQIAITAQSGTNQIDIAPGDANYERVGRPFVFAEDSHILTLNPRMNERGKDFRYTLVYPDGTSRVLLNLPKWNYGWVFTYVLSEPVAAPKGSRIETVAHWDNSAANKLNPDPSVRVPFGPEIMNGYFEYVVDRQDLTRSTQE